MKGHRRRLVPSVVVTQVRRTPSLRPAARKPSRRRQMNWPAVTSLITALTAVGALIFTGLSLNATRDQVAIAQSQNAVVEQGQFTDRYGKAVEQIGRQGADHLQIRLGGIYALERLAHDSPRDQPTIIEVLTAFIRTNTPPSAPPETLRTPVTCPDQRIPADVQAALTVISRRDAAQDRKAVVDLHETCLVGAVFDGSTLTKANFIRANLTNSAFYSADLSSAEFWAADFTGVQSFTRPGAKPTVCSHTDFRFANLAKFGAICGVMDGAQFADANLIGANLALSYAHGADFSRAILWRADLAYGDFQDASFRFADLNEADIKGAHLRGVDLRDTRHDRTRIDDAETDDRTKGKWW
ncbi:pentapeptide repeat-containing protein [Actinocrispum sp. NPDC049592]|uniref:pentapeptide repeat-containing protein n=1 Tax=Actinocrispum sp. NPDC049592 TaxID=3154835 RepID=UPI00344589B8